MTTQTGANGRTSRANRLEELYAVAGERFARRGYRATTLDDVAGALDIKKASLYHYINSKEDLLLGIYERIFTRIEQAVLPIANLDLPVDERLRRMLHAHVEVVAGERAMLTVAFQEEAELSGVGLVSIRQRKRAYQRVFEQTIEEGQRLGVLKPLNPRTMVLALFGMCNWMYQWYRSDRHSWPDIAAEFTLLLESGWLADGDTRQGAWPKAASVDQALDPVRDAAECAVEELARLRRELARAEDRLSDGLVPDRQLERERTSRQKGSNQPETDVGRSGRDETGS